MIKRLFQSFHPLEQLEKQRQEECGKGTLATHLKPIFQAPVPAPDTPLEALDLVVLDFETSGLDPETDAILSVGMVEIRQQILSLSSGQHYYLLAADAVKPETAVINHIVPETLAGGMTEQACVEKIIATLAGKVVVAHGAAIEQGFLRRAFQLAPDALLPLVWLDTLMLERSLSANRGKMNPDLRLCHIREQKGLPPYLAHNALADAVATGELLLVLIREIFAGKTPVLGPLVQRSLKGYA